jgi:catechol 2,3-dioxygenase-like lactoylglutathione lyase family enzyme
MEVGVEAIVSQMLEQFERGTITRRQLIQGISALALSAIGSDASAQRKPVGFTSTKVHHISFQVADYARTRDFYVDLLGLRVSNDDPTAKQCFLHVGDSVILARTATGGRKPPIVDHFAIGIANWNKAEAEEKLKVRNLQYRPDQQVPNDSFHLRDPDGYDLQVIDEKVP